MKLEQSGSLPFQDNEFDIVFCSSVIEHVTGEKSYVLGIDDKAEFNKIARAHQKEFASEIRRIGKAYFVQTPYKYFPIESHSWLPFCILWLSRRNLKALLKWSSLRWPKKTEADWALLSVREMRRLFPDGEILLEWSGPFIKSIMAVKRTSE